jgi:hypothetical protein
LKKCNFVSEEMCIPPALLSQSIKRSVRHMSFRCIKKAPRGHP